MKRNNMHVIILGLCLLSNSLYASAVSLGKVIKHNEWVTGDLKIKYTLANENRDMNDGLIHQSNKFELKDKFVHSVPIIRSVNTAYHNDGSVTKINSGFLVDAQGFKSYEQSQLFAVYRETCIRPYPVNPDNQLTCVNTEDEVLVDDVMIENIVWINLEAYNLRPGKYIAFSNMSVKKSDSEIAYLTDGNTVEFTIDAPPLS